MRPAGRGHGGTTIATQAPPQLEISILGPLRARRGGEELALGGRRQRAVLARLAVAEGAPVGADRLIDELWDGEPPRSAVNTLQSYVSTLRRVLDGGDERTVIERVGDGYRLSVPRAAMASAHFDDLVGAAVASTAPLPDRVAALDEALALWHGPALAEFSDLDWAQGAAVRLDEMRLTAVEARFDLQLQAGLHRVIVGDLEHAATAHPLRERLTAQLMLALYRSGRQAEALRAYDRARRHLGEELGLDPGPELTRLHTRILEHDPDLAGPDGPAGPDAAAPAPAAGTDAAPSTPESATSPDAPGVVLRPRAIVPPGLLHPPPAIELRRGQSEFVGREAELAELTRHWRAVIEGGQRLLVISGEAGMGKTRLAQQFARQVHSAGADGTHVFWGRCTAEVLTAYQPIIEALRTATRAIGDEASLALFQSRPVLARLVPDILPEPPSGRTERYELYDALLGLVEEVTEGRAVMMVIDDVQWVDPSTLSLVDHLMRHENQARLLVLATLRRPAGRPTVELDRLLSEHTRAGRAATIHLGGLDTGAVGELLDARGHAVDAATAEDLAERTGGNPFFIESLAEQGGELLPIDPRSVPASVREVLDQRLVSLDPEVARVLTAAAVIGVRAELGLLGRVTGLDAGALLDVVDAAVAEGLLGEDEEVGWVAFPHALVRQSLIARTTRNREAHLHLLVADAIEAAPSRTGDLSTLAEHLLAAGALCPPERTARAALDAGRQALELRSDIEARTWARRGLDALRATPDDSHLVLRAELGLLLSATARHLGPRDAAVAAVGDVVRWARASGDPHLLALAAQESALLEAGVGFSFGTVDEDLIALVDEALAATPDDDVVDRSMLLAWASIARHNTLDVDRQRALAAEARDLAESVEGQPRLLGLARFARRISMFGPDGLDERLAIGRQMRDDPPGWGELETVATVLDFVDQIEAGLVDEVERTVEHLRQVVAPYDRPVFDAYLEFVQACVALARGEVDRAAELSDHALTIGATHGNNAVQAWAAQQFMVARERGQVGTMLGPVEEMVEQFPALPVWRAALAVCRLALGDPEGAREAYAPVIVDGELVTMDPSTWYTTVSQLAEVAWAVGDADACRVLADAMRPFSGRQSITGLGAICTGPIDRYLGLALAGVGDLDGAAEALERAEALAACGGLAPWRARALVERAQVLATRGAPGDAEQAAALAAEGEKIADELGLTLPLLPPST